MATHRYRPSDCPCHKDRTQSPRSNEPAAQVASTSAHRPQRSDQQSQLFRHLPTQDAARHSRPRRPNWKCSTGAVRARPWCCSRAPATTRTSTISSPPPTSSTDRFRVIGITRRGFGRSSQPASGYDLDTRARDDIAVLDTLKIGQAVFVGHSLAGTELSKLGAVYPHRVRKLVYLDALDIGSSGWASIPQPPSVPDPTAVDLESVQRLAASLARDDGYRKPLAAVCNMIRIDSSGRAVGPVTPPEILAKLMAGLQPAEYGRIRAPALGIFNRITPRFRAPYYWSLAPAKQQEFNRSISMLPRPGSTERSGTSAPRSATRESSNYRTRTTTCTSWTKRWSCEKCASSCSGL